ncbi:hypothetical protein QYE76_006646 [Lolium multiflorum]|uniref:Transposase-associated domain-containing protein n=1 Tax=Lolium multiflorum TaxID=4521 RepID=A0AAD8RV49_LOLMU|nr:hypothetical protein QYE76_006646 [Lolium multiflorum]
MVSLAETIGVLDAAVGSTPAYAREMLAGGVAGVVAKTAVAPLGRLKLLRRVGGAPGAEAEGAVRTLVGIYRREGFAGLYRGNGANALRVFPSKALHFAAYERYRGWLGGAGGGGALADLLAGSAAGGTALLATYPLDLARARLACGGDGACTSVRGVLRAAYAEGGLYRGLRPALARALPKSGIKFWAYESLKRRLPEGWGGRAEAQMACGVAAAQLASTATYPLAVVRRRMQLGLCAGGGVLEGVRTIAREEGVRRLYAGLGIAEGVNSFLLVAEANKSKQGFMCCPCLKCKNEKDYSCSRDIKSHLLRFGFISSYNVWTKHGEEGVMMEDGDEEEDNDEKYYRSMFSECFDTAMDDNEEEGGEEQASDDPVDDDLRRAISDARRDCDTDKERLQFDKMLEDHHKLLYPGCEDGHRKLGSILELLKWKAEVGVTDSGFEKLMIILKKLFPRNNELPVVHMKQRSLSAL